MIKDSDVRMCKSRFLYFIECLKSFPCRHVLVEVKYDYPATEQTLSMQYACGQVGSRN